MKNLKPFSGDAKKEYKDAVGRKPKDSDSSKRLGAIDSDIETAYDHYKQNFDTSSLHTVATRAWSSEFKEDLLILEDFYNLLRNRRFGRMAGNWVMIWQPCLLLRSAVCCCICHSS